MNSMDIVKNIISTAGLILIIAVMGANVLSEDITIKSGSGMNISLKKEVQHAIEKGLNWLKTVQNEEGYWSQKDYPALTALALTAYMGEPSGKYRAEKNDFIDKGYEYLKGCVKPDGGIYVEELSNYNTAVSIMAFQVAHNPEYEPILRKARNFLTELQGDFGEKGKIDTPYDGGIGYGGSYPHSDMSNTVLALEALYYTKYLGQDQKSKMKELNWEAAVKFIERCQNLPEHNDQDWASDDPENKGGFVYFPGNSKAGEMKLPSGETALRSYGSMSYAGLLSYIYAEMDSDDPRVEAVYDWLRENFSLTENPGMGPQGLYYYYHTMAKALSRYGIDELKLETGEKIDWRKKLALKLFDLQKPEGYWLNDNGRWWEKDPVLVTAYSVIALEIIYQGL